VPSPVLLGGLHPAAPIALRGVARGRPHGPAKVILVEDHLAEAIRTDAPESLLGQRQHVSPEPLSSAIRIDRKAIAQRDVPPGRAQCCRRGATSEV